MPGAGKGSGDDFKNLMMDMSALENFLLKDDPVVKKGRSTGPRAVPVARFSPKKGQIPLKQSPAHRNVREIRARDVRSPEKSLANIPRAKKSPRIIDPIRRSEPRYSNRNDPYSELRNSTPFTYGSQALSHVPQALKEKRRRSALHPNDMLEHRSVSQARTSRSMYNMRTPDINSRSRGMFFHDGDHSGLGTSPQIRYKYRGEQFDAASVATRSFHGGVEPDHPTQASESMAKRKKVQTQVQTVDTEPESQIFPVSWTIEQAMIHDDAIESEQFHLDKTILTVRFELTKNEEDYVNCIVKVIFETIPEHFGDISTVIKSNQGEILFSSEFKTINHSIVDVVYITCTSKNFESLILNLRLGITIEMQVRIFTEDATLNYPTAIEENRELTIMRQLYDERVLADCRLLSEGRAWPVHRAVLGMQSKVLRKQFELGKVDGELQVNLPPEVIDELIEFLYLGRLKDSKNLRSLLQLGYQFQIHSLVDFCLAGLADKAPRGVKTVRPLAPGMGMQMY